MKTSSGLNDINRGDRDMRANTHRSKASVSMLVLFILGACLLLQSCDAPDPTGPAATARMTLTATDLQIPADGSSSTLITAYVKNPQGNPADGPIYWTTTCGSLDKSSETMSDGVASVTLTAPNYGCTAVVTADAVHVKKDIAITCYSIDAVEIEVWANPSSIPADGYSISTITARIEDERDLPVPDGTNVIFSTTGGTLSASSASTVAGRASVNLTSETVPKDARVSATVGTRSDYCEVYFYSTAVGRLELRANPSSNIPCDGSSSSIITATVYDVNGNLMEDGTTVFFASTWGQLSATSSTTSRGVATVTLRSLYDSSSDHTARVTAVSGDRSASVNVGFSRYSGTPQTPANTAVPTSTPTPQPTSGASQTPTPVPSRTATPTPTISPSASATPTFTPLAHIPDWYVRESDQK